MTEMKGVARAAVLAAVLGFLTGSFTLPPSPSAGKIERVMQQAKTHLIQVAADVSKRP